jgi:hypothetical protein
MSRVGAALPHFDETQGSEERDDLAGFQNRDARHYRVNSE